MIKITEIQLNSEYELANAMILHKHFAYSLKDALVKSAKSPKVIIHNPPLCIEIKTSLDEFIDFLDNYEIKIKIVNQ